jgi:hypothetical protein
MVFKQTQSFLLSALHQSIELQHRPPVCDCQNRVRHQAEGHLRTADVNTLPNHSFALSVFRTPYAVCVFSFIRFARSVDVTEPVAAAHGRAPATCSRSSRPSATRSKVLVRRLSLLLFVFFAACTCDLRATCSVFRNGEHEDLHVRREYRFAFYLSITIVPSLPTHPRTHADEHVGVRSDGARDGVARQRLVRSRRSLLLSVCFGGGFFCRVKNVHSDDSFLSRNENTARSRAAFSTR